MSIENEKDLEALRRVGRLVALALQRLGRLVRPGISTREIDEAGRAMLELEGARPAPELAYGFPGAVCISVDDEAAHGIPGPRILAEGQLVNIDVSAELGGYFADTGASFPVGRVSEEKARLCAATRNALARGLAVAKAGQPINAYGRVVENEARRHGFKVIENLAGHGVGRKLHEPPHDVACFFDRRNKARFAEGTVLTLEPFLSTGARKVITAKDGWTQKTPDRSVTAQYEHTIVITRSRPIVLTAC
jgi:methionyl aminopeptidase